MDKIEKELQIIVLPGLEGNTPMELTSLQEFMQPHIESLQVFWWCVWIGTIIYLFYNYILKQILQGLFSFDYPKKSEEIN